MITPFLWYDTQAEEAARFYVSVFKNSQIIHVSKQGDGRVVAVVFELDGQKFSALNGGPLYKFNEAISFVVPCETQAEIDEYWEKLTADGGQESRCGWLKDKYGLSWQITPANLGRMLNDPDPSKAQRTMAAMLQMKKLDIAALESA